jgi:hypothetical protein
MKKKVCTIVVIALLVLMLIPVKMYLEDGGTKIYRAVLYEVVDMHRLNPEYNEDDSVPQYIEGTILRILGIEVYNSVQKR